MMMIIGRLNIDVSIDTNEDFQMLDLKTGMFQFQENRFWHVSKFPQRTEITAITKFSITGFDRCIDR